jgi:hypothetical protein
LYACSLATGPQIDHLEFVRDLLHLSTLLVADSTVNDLAPLATAVALTTLHLTGIKQGNVGLLPLSGLTALRVISFEGSTAIEDISPLARLHAPEELNVEGTSVVNLLPLQSHASLVIKAKNAQPAA